MFLSKGEALAIVYVHGKREWTEKLSIFGTPLKSRIFALSVDPPCSRFDEHKRASGGGCGGAGHSVLKIIILKLETLDFYLILVLTIAGSRGSFKTPFCRNTG